MTTRPKTLLVALRRDDEAALFICICVPPRRIAWLSLSTQPLAMGPVVSTAALD